MLSNSFAIIAHLQRHSGLWEISIDGPQWLIRDMMGELNATGGKMVVKDGSGGTRLTLQQRPPLFTMGE